MGGVEFREIAVDSERDLELLRKFYDEVYQVVFPDADERESFDSLVAYLHADAALGSEADDGLTAQPAREAGLSPDERPRRRPYAYHVVVMLSDAEPVGGVIFDYLAEPNCGVIEFLCISPTRQGGGRGRALLEETERLLEDDARRIAGQELGWIIAEMDDPFAPRRTADTFDSFDRALVWDRWGYRAADFPYVQPALSEDQEPVRHLLLIAKLLAHPASDWSTGDAQAVAPGALATALHEYLRWAMRIDEPAANPEYREMAEHLATRQDVALIRLDEYVGMAPEALLHIRVVASADDPALEDAIDVYERVFTDPEEAIAANAFRASFSPRPDRQAGCHYHLWAVSAVEGQVCEGMASFFTLPSAGFGGYVALTGSIRGKGLLGPLLRRMEQRMVRDDSSNTGWYIECGDKTDRRPFTRQGFRELDVDYRQPQLPMSGSPESADLSLHLLYKPFGRVYDDQLTVADCLTAVAEILRCVYGVEEPLDHPSYVAVAAGLGDAPIVPFC